MELFITGILFYYHLYKKRERRDAHCRDAQIGRLYNGRLYNGRLYDIGDYLTREEKLNVLGSSGSRVNRHIARQRGCCPSCGQKRALMLSHRLQEEVFAQVPHRQWVFTIPKRLRLYLRYDQSLLGKRGKYS